MDYSKPHTLEEWIGWYEQKTGDTFTLPDDYTINYHEKRGLMAIKPVFEKKMLVIEYVIGDGRFWYDVADMLARQNGLRYIATICTRSVYAYIRFWKYKVIKTWEIDGAKRFLGIDDMGYYGTMTYSGKDKKTGNDTYIVIRYVVKGEKPELDE